MRVALHAVAATKHGASTEVIRGTMRGLLAAAPGDEYYLFLNPNLDIELPAEIHRVDADSRGGRVGRVLWDQISYPRILKRVGADLSVAMLGFAAIRTPVPQIAILQNALYFCDRVSRGNPNRLVGVEKQLLRQVVRSSAKTVVPSQTMKLYLRTQFGLRREISVIPDAWDGEYVDPQPQCWSEPWQLLYIAHLERHKAHLDLIEVAHLLAERQRRFEINVSISELDDPELYHRFAEERASRGLSDFIKIHGRLSHSEVEHLLGEADCFISPSRCESFGYAYIEATAAGCPVISADIPIAREMLGNGALFFPPGDAVRAADQVEALAAEAGHGLDLVRRAQKHQKEFVFDWNEYGRRLHEVIRSTARI